MTVAVSRTLLTHALRSTRGALWLLWIVALPETYLSLATIEPQLAANSDVNQMELVVVWRVQ